MKVAGTKEESAAEDRDRPHALVMSGVIALGLTIILASGLSGGWGAEKYSMWLLVLVTLALVFVTYNLASVNKRQTRRTTEAMRETESQRQVAAEDLHDRRRIEETMVEVYGTRAWRESLKKELKREGASTVNDKLEPYGVRVGRIRDLFPSLKIAVSLGRAKSKHQQRRKWIDSVRRRDPKAAEFLERKHHREEAKRERAREEQQLRMAQRGDPEIIAVRREMEEADWWPPDE